MDIVAHGKAAWRQIQLIGVVCLLVLIGAVIRRSCSSPTQGQAERDAATLRKVVGLWIASVDRWNGKLAIYLVIDDQGRFRTGIDRQASGWWNGQLADFFAETSGEVAITGTCTVRGDKLIMTVADCNAPGVKLVKGDVREVAIVHLSEAQMQLGGDEFDGFYSRRR